LTIRSYKVIDSEWALKSEFTELLKIFFFCMIRLSYMYVPNLVKIAL